MAVSTARRSLIRPRRRPRRGLSVAEAVIAGALLAVMLATSSAVIVAATRSVDDPPEVAATRTVREALDRVNEDLTLATAITTLTTSQIVVTVPDRNGDGVPESIGYRWDGLASGTLFRQFNGAAEVALIPSVGHLDIELVQSERDDEPAIASDATAFILACSARGTTTETAVTSLGGVAESISLVFPTGTKSWVVTGVRLRCRQGTATTGVIDFALRDAIGLIPQGTVLSSLQVRGGSLPTATGWFTIDLPDVTLPATTTSVALTITTTSATAPIQVEVSRPTAPSSWDAESTGLVGSWTSVPTCDLSYELLGRVSLPKSSVVVDARAVRLRLTVAGAMESSFTLVTPLRNRPAL